MTDQAADTKTLLAAVRIADKYGQRALGAGIAELAEHVAAGQIDPALEAM
jgi:hypothetical protein